MKFEKFLENVDIFYSLAFKLGHDKVYNRKRNNIRGVFIQILVNFVFSIPSENEKFIQIFNTH